MIENPSDQVVGYAEETANAVEKISKRYNYDKAFSLLIVQTAIESMKLDCEQHKLIAYSQKLTDAIDMLFIISRIIEEKE